MSIYDITYTRVFIIELKEKINTLIKYIDGLEVNQNALEKLKEKNKIITLKEFK